MTEPLRALAEFLGTGLLVTAIVGSGIAAQSLDRGVGIDITNEVPEALGNDAVDASDVVITMGCGDTCPVFPGKRYLDWELEDPAWRTLDEVRSIPTRSTERFAHSYAIFFRRLSSCRSQRSAKYASLDRLVGDRGWFASRQ
jgi:hypothetical protein